jgi:hypothetical protein
MLDGVVNRSRGKDGVKFFLCSGGIVFFYVDHNSKMTTTAGHSFYIGPIGFFYYQVNDTGS